MSFSLLRISKIDKDKKPFQKLFNSFLVFPIYGLGLLLLQREAILYKEC